MFSFYNGVYEVKVKEMEREDSISFSSVVAALLLLDRQITSVEIVNFLSRLDCEDIEVSEENDDVDELLVCVLVGDCYSYSLKESLEYDTVLFQEVTVHDFLESMVDSKVLHLILSDSAYSKKYWDNFPKNKETKTVSFSKFISSKQEVEKRMSGFGKVKKLIKRNPWYSFLGGVR